MNAFRPASLQFATSVCRGKSYLLESLNVLVVVPQTENCDSRNVVEVKDNYRSLSIKLILFLFSTRDILT